MSVSLHLGDEFDNYLDIEVLERTNPRATDDFYDGNWLRTLVRLATGPWTGTLGATLRAEDFTRFRAELQTLYDDVEAPPAKFDSMEPWLEFVVERSDRLGHVTVVGEAQGEPFGKKSSILRFVIYIDQSYLAATLRDLAEITREFPVVAAPNE
jgi:hypothetical protein